jgi:hypothetical protein
MNKFLFRTAVTSYILALLAIIVELSRQIVRAERKIQTLEKEGWPDVWNEEKQEYVFEPEA